MIPRLPRCLFAGSRYGASQELDPDTRARKQRLPKLVFPLILIYVCTRYQSTHGVGNRARIRQNTQTNGNRCENKHKHEFLALSETNQRSTAEDKNRKRHHTLIIRKRVRVDNRQVGWDFCTYESKNIAVRILIRGFTFLIAVSSSPSPSPHPIFYRRPSSSCPILSRSSYLGSLL